MATTWAIGMDNEKEVRAPVCDQCGPATATLSDKPENAASPFAGRLVAITLGEPEPTPPFWIVFRDSPQGTTVRFRHLTEKSAQAEAARLSRETGDRFYVLQTIGSIARADAPLVWTPSAEAKD